MRAAEAAVDAERARGARTTRTRPSATPRSPRSTRARGRTAASAGPGAGVKCLHAHYAWLPRRRRRSRRPLGRGRLADGGRRDDRVAAVDIGTNSARLLVADVDGAGRDAQLTHVDRRMRITRLGQGVERRPPAAIPRRSRARSRCCASTASAIDALGVTRVRATATSASRDATQPRRLLRSRAEQLLGVRPELLSGEEEARARVPRRDRRARRARRRTSWSTSAAARPSSSSGPTTPDGLISIDIGCVRLTEQFLHSDPPTPEELSEAVSVVRDHLADVDRVVPGAARREDARRDRGNGVDDRRDRARRRREYDSERIHHFRLTRAAAEEVFRTLATEPIAPPPSQPRARTRPGRRDRRRRDRRRRGDAALGLRRDARVGSRHPRRPRPLDRRDQSRSVASP